MFKFYRHANNKIIKRIIQSTSYKKNFSSTISSSSIQDKFNNFDANNSTSTTEPMLLNDLNINDIIYGFKLLNKEYSNDYDLTYYNFIHEETGAEYIHLDRNDTDNVFSIAFRTPPNDSSGIAHILEHTVLW